MLVSSGLWVVGRVWNELLKRGRGRGSFGWILEALAYRFALLFRFQSVLSNQRSGDDGVGV